MIYNGIVPMTLTLLCASDASGVRQSSRVLRACVSHSKREYWSLLPSRVGLSVLPSGGT